MLDRASVSTRISAQRQSRHVQGTPQYGSGQGGGYLHSADDAQRVLDAFHRGTADIVSVSTRGGHVKVRVPEVTGVNVNPAKGYPAQPTNTFLIKGTSRPSIVPTSP